MTGRLDQLNTHDRGAADKSMCRDTGKCPAPKGSAAEEPEDGPAFPGIRGNG